MVVGDGILTVSKARGAGNIETKQKFKDYQLHVEFRIPENITGSGQARGNSGVFSPPPARRDGYEMQVLDSYNNTTYVNGQAAASTSRARRCELRRASRANAVVRLI